MKTKVLFMTFLFAMSSTVFSGNTVYKGETNNIINNLNMLILEMRTEIRAYDIKVDCDGDGIWDMECSGNFTEKNAIAMEHQMLDACDDEGVVIGN